MLMSPDSSSAADPDPILACHTTVLQSSLPSSVIQVPECTQSHGGSQTVVTQHVPQPPIVHHVKVTQFVDYKKIETPNGYNMTTTQTGKPVLVQQTQIYHQKPSHVSQKSDEDLNLGTN